MDEQKGPLQAEVDGVEKKKGIEGAKMAQLEAWVNMTVAIKPFRLDDGKQVELVGVPAMPAELMPVILEILGMEAASEADLERFHQTHGAAIPKELAIFSIEKFVASSGAERDVQSIYNGKVGEDFFPSEFAGGSILAVRKV